MSARIIDGVALGKQIRAEVAAEVARLADTSRKWFPDESRNPASRP